MSKFIKLTMPEANTKAIINIDHITMVFEQSDGVTVVVHDGGEVCVVESVGMVWDMIGGEISEVVAMNEWISVDDGLPRAEVATLVVTNLGNYHIMSYWLYDDFDPTWVDHIHLTESSDFLDDQEEVTHWMELPEKPNN